MTRRMQGFEHDTLTAIIHGKRVWLLHLVTNALLIAAFFYWTRIPEETKLQFAFTVVSGFGIIFLMMWLHSATFDYFRMPSSGRVRDSLRRSVAHVPAFLVWSIIFGIVLWLIGQLGIYDEQAGGWIRHMLPAFLRRHVTPRSAFSAISWVGWFLYFFLLPILFLPVGAQVAERGFRGFFAARGFRPIRLLRFWLAYFVCFVVGAYVPYELAWMIPRKPSPLNEQTWSMVTRLGAGYVFLITAWLLLCAAITRASDDGPEVLREPEPLAAPQ
jgi:hypothetical protein